MSACLHVVSAHGSMPREARRGSWIPWSQSPMLWATWWERWELGSAFLCRAQLLSHWTVSPPLWCPVVSWRQSAPLLDGLLWERCVWACSVLQKLTGSPWGSVQVKVSALHFIYLITYPGTLLSFYSVYKLSLNIWLVQSNRQLNKGDKKRKNFINIAPSVFSNVESRGRNSKYKILFPGIFLAFKNLLDRFKLFL